MRTTPTFLIFHILFVCRVCSVFGALIPAGVPLHAPGQLNLIVEDSEVNIDIVNRQQCRGSLEIWYPVKTIASLEFAVSGHADMCSLKEGHLMSARGYATTCPLKKTEGNAITIETNAKLTDSASTKMEYSNTRIIVIIVVSIIVPLVLITVGGLLAWFVLRPCWRRRQGYQRVPPQSSPAEGKKKAATKPSTPAPPPPVASNPEIKKVVPPAPSTMEDVDFDFGEQKKTTPEPRRKPKWDGVPFSGDRAFEDYNDLADRGSALTPTPAGSKGSRKSRKSKKSKKRNPIIFA